MKKTKIPVVCRCKEVIHCSKNCQRSSSHRCHKVATLTPQGKAKMPKHETASKVMKKCYDRFLEDQAANRGPSSERIKATMQRTERSGRGADNLMALAEEGDPVAAFVVGFAYAERRTTKERYHRGEAGRYILFHNTIQVV